MSLLFISNTIVQNFQKLEVQVDVDAHNIWKHDNYNE